jgi:hypothetical protein
MDILERKKVTIVKGQQQTKTIAQIHLKRVAELECNFQEEKARNEDLNHFLGQAGETSTKLE